MVKIKQIGNKKEIMDNKKRQAQFNQAIGDFAEKNEKDLMDWIEKHFSGLKDEAKIGLEQMARLLWAFAIEREKIRPSD